MDFDRTARSLDGIPYTSPSKGRVFYDLVLQRRPKRILELGFAHGVSTCYFAAAAQELGDCSITAVDLEQSRGMDPAIETLVNRLGFEQFVTVEREQSSYTWFLKREIAAQTRNQVCTPKYDLVFIDGPKDWTNDGCAFFLADKLLTPGGTILFDDYSWSYRGDETARGKAHSRGYVFANMSEAEYVEPQIKAVFELLVMQHPSYSNFVILDDQLAMATKSEQSGTRRLLIDTRYSLKYRAISWMRKSLLPNKPLRAQG
jgi:predicted O-methyltransferase YrrM